MAADASSPLLTGHWRKSSRSETKACVEVALIGRATSVDPSLPDQPAR